MVERQLFENQATGWVTTGALDNSYTFGVPFASTSGGYVVGLVWRRESGASKPRQLALYDSTTGAQVALVSSADVVDSAAAGWQVTPLTSAVPLVAGREYRTTSSFNTSNALAYHPIPTIAGPDSPLVLGDTTYYSNTSLTVMPSTVGSSDLRPGIDVIWNATGELLPGATGGTSGPPGAGATAGDLADWLDTVIGSQLHSAPLLTQALAALWNAGLGDAANGYFAFMKTALLAVKERTDRLPDSIEALTNAILDAGVAETEAIQANLALIQAGVDALTGGSGGTAGGALGALSGRSAFPATGWSMADETDWDTDLAWPVAADLYVFTVTTPPPGAAADSFAGVTWYHRLGSWTTLDGDQAGARAFLEFSPQQLQDGGRRMPGLALRTKNGTLGHVQAWVLA